MNRIISELKSQPLIGAVTIIGTALAVFMIMVVVMLQSVSTTPFAPEHRCDYHGRSNAFQRSCINARCIVIIKF